MYAVTSKVITKVMIESNKLLINEASKLAYIKDFALISIVMY